MMHRVLKPASLIGLFFLQAIFGLAPSGAVLAATAEQNVLKSFCRLEDISAKECKNAVGYPSGNGIGGPICNVKLDGGIFEISTSGKRLVLASYFSDCEPHATNYGGTVILEGNGRDLTFLSFVVGERIGSDCVPIAGRYGEDSIYCVVNYSQMGTSEDSLIQYIVSYGNTGKLDSIHSQIKISAENNYGSGVYYFAACNRRIQYYTLDNLRRGPSADTLEISVKYADAEVIRKSCSNSGFRPKGEVDNPEKGSVFVNPKLVKQANFILDIESGEFALEQRYLNLQAPTQPQASDLSKNALLLPTSERRVALVFGNSEYRNVPPLQNPDGDSEAIAAEFKTLGFSEVTLIKNADEVTMLSALSKFSDSTSTADWAVIYFAGHGIVVDGKNFLIPIDASLKSDRQVAFQAISLDQMMNAASGAQKLRLILLDSCRENPFIQTMRLADASRGVTRGLARVEPSVGTMVVYAARDGELAADGIPGEHSPFTAALLHAFIQPNVELNLLLRKVRDEVLAATANQQEPYSYGSLPGLEFYFARSK